MRLAVISDIHDHLDNLRAVQARLSALQPQALILCGDISSPATLEAAALPDLPLAFCLGNCDSGQALRSAAARLGFLAFGDIGEWRLPSGKRIAFTHYPSLAQKTALSGRYDAVFFGHSHRRHEERLQVNGRECLLANPGDIQGRHGPPGGLVWDSTSGIVEWA